MFVFFEKGILFFGLVCVYSNFRVLLCRFCGKFLVFVVLCFKVVFLGSGKIVCGCLKFSLKSCLIFFLFFGINKNIKRINENVIEIDVYDVC